MSLPEDALSIAKQYRRFNNRMDPYTPQNEEPLGKKLLRKLLGSKGYVMDIYDQIPYEPNYLDKLRLMIRGGEEFWR